MLRRDASASGARRTKESHDHEASNRAGAEGQAATVARLGAIIAAGVPLATSLKGKTPGQTCGREQIALVV
jgi:hypothetical protein